MAPDQLQWLIADLEKVDKNTPIVAVLHIPMLTFFTQLEMGATVATPHNLALNNSVEVLGAFKDKNWRMFFKFQISDASPFRRERTWETVPT